MSRHFRPWKIDQTQLLPSAIADYVPADHLAQFVVALARESLDLSGIELCGKVGDGVNQAADLISATASIPSLNFIPLTTFGNWF